MAEDLIEKFTNAETAAKYEYTGPTWRKGIAWPGVYEGKVCDIPPAVAQKLVDTKHPLFKLKAGAKAEAKQDEKIK